MGAAVGQRLDVMDFLGRGEGAAFVALLTEGVGGGVSVTDALPRSAVAMLGGGVPLVAFVAAVLLLGVPRRTVHRSGWDSRGNRRDAWASLAWCSPQFLSLNSGVEYGIMLTNAWYGMA